MTDARPRRALLPPVPLAALLLVGLLAMMSAPPAGAVDATPVAADQAPAPDTATAPADTSTTLAEHEFHLMPAGQRPLPLAHGFVEPGSLRLLVEGERWVEGRDFHLRARTGLVIPLRGWRAAPARGEAATGPGAGLALVSATYRFLPATPSSRLDLREVSPPPLSAANAPGGLAAPGIAGGTGAEGSAGGTGWRDEGLRVSGSKTVQVSSGSRREMTVDQNLRLSLDGRLTPDVSVRAFLSDDNLPVVPEGNTEELKDIDKVLVEIRGPAWQATLGDLVVQRRGTAFGDVRRKLQGLDVRATGGATTVEAVAGAPRGAYRTVQLQGQEANQGPYRLAGGEGGANLFLVAGSERVSLDGQSLVRGADRDYVIDYVLGTITFTYRRLITAESLITVEFEQGEGAYSRTVLGAGVEHAFASTLPGVPARLRARVLREADDPARLRTGDLADGDESLLAAAGDDLERAVASGVTAAAAGQGGYTLALAGADTIYVFAPGGGDWDVVFYHAGTGLGDYRLDSLTSTGRRVYVHVGQGQGAYRVGRPLAMPGSHSLATFALSLGDSAGSGIDAEWNASQVDRNLLSELDEDDNGGGAGRVAARWRGNAPRVGGRGTGRLSVDAAWEGQDARFAPLQLRRTIAQYETWGLGARARRDGFLDEADRRSEARLAWQADGRRGAVELGVGLGSLRHGDAVAADRAALDGRWRVGAGAGRHEVTRAGARDALDPLDITRRAQRHEVSWRVGALQPALVHERREWRDDALAAGPVARAAGSRFEESGAVLTGAHKGGAGWRLDFRRGQADSLRDGNWQRERDSRTAGASVTSGSFGGMRLVGEGTWRRSEQPAGPVESTRLARLDLAGRWERTGSDWSLGYRVDNSRSEVLDRQIVFVGDQQGDFDEDGDYVGQDLGDYDVVLAGTDSLVATTAVRGDLRWRQSFAFLGRENWYGGWSTQTTASLEGRSTTDRIGRLLALDPAVIFDGRTAVLGDLNVAQEISLLEHEPRFDLRGRFGYRQARDRQFAAHPEDRLDRRWQATGSANVSARVTLRGRYATEAERRESTESAFSARRSQDLTTRRLELGWQLAPGPDLRVGLQGERVTRGDAASGIAQREWALRPSARARLRSGWSTLLEARWSTVASDEPPGALRPYVFPYPGGNVEATWRVSWEPSRTMTVSASWFARRQGERGWQHDLRLESTARF